MSLGGNLAQYGRLAGVRLFPLTGPAIWINPTQPRVAGVRAIPDLRVQFVVQKSTSSEPQRATVRLFNLGKIHRDLIATYARRPQAAAQPSGLVDGRIIRNTIVEVLAGYEGMGAAAAIFRGDLSSVSNRHVGTEWVTTLELGDSEAALTQATLEQSFPPGTPALTVILAALARMGLTLGPAPVPESVSAYVLARGWASYGRARDTIDAILAGCAPDLSQLPTIVKAVGTLASLVGLMSGPSPLTRPVALFVDDGLAYLLQRATALPGAPVQVSATAQPGTIRLLERPERLDDGGVRVRCLLSPGLRPGWPVTIASRELAGAYRIDVVEHAGDLRGGSFTSTADLRPTIPL